MIIKGLKIVFFLVFLFVSQASFAQQGPTDVFVFEVKTEDFADRIEAIGTLKANETVEITANVTEKISKIRFDDNQRVQAGDVLVEMTSTEEAALLSEAISNRDEAEKQYERTKALVESKTLSQSILDQRQRDYNTAKARLDAVISRMEDRVIKAPFSGVVGLRQISKGALVSPGVNITTLDDDSVMKLDFSVPSTFLFALKPGLKIIAKSKALDDEEFEGEISNVDSRIDTITRTVLVRAIIPNPDRKLKPGLLMSIELFKNPRNVILMPEEAIITEGDNTYVMVVKRTEEGGRIAQKRKLILGSRKPGYVEVKDGLLEGELIITHGNFKVRDGSPINIKDNLEETKVKDI